LEDEDMDIWKARTGKFCIIDYDSPLGVKTALGILQGTIGNRIIIRNPNNNEEFEIRVDMIKSSRVKKWEDYNDRH